MLSDLPASCDLALYEGDTPTLYFDVSADLTGSAVYFTVKTLRGEVVSKSTHEDDLEVIYTPLLERSRVQFKRFPNNLRGQSRKTLLYDLQVIFPNGFIKTYVHGSLEVESDVSPDG